MNIGGRIVRLMAASSLILVGACKSPTDSTIVNITITDTTSVNNGGGDGNGGGGVIGGGGQCASGQNPSITFSPNSASGNVGDTQPVTATISCGPTAGTWSTTNANGIISNSGSVVYMNVGQFQVCYTLTSGLKACSGTWTTNPTSNGGDEPTVTGVTISNPHVDDSTCNAWPGQPFSYSVSTTNGAPTGVTFTLMTHHAFQSINISTGMLTRKSPAVAGTDTVKIASSFDPSKFAIGTITVTLCDGGGKTVTATPSSLNFTMCPIGYTGSTPDQQITVFVNGVAIPASDVTYIQSGELLLINSATGRAEAARLGSSYVRVAPKNDPNNYVQIPISVTSTACQAPSSTVSPVGPINLGSGTGCTNNTVQFTASSAGTWSSSNASIATVNSSGLVTAVSNANGSVTITFIPSNGGSPITRTVNVSNVSCTDGGGGEVVTSIDVSPDHLNLLIGQSNQLSAVVTVSSGSAPTPTWSQNSNCVQLSTASGNVVTVTAVRACSTYVVAMANGVRDSSLVTVTSGVTSIDYTPPGGTINVGQEVTLTATCVLASGATCTPYWYSSSPSRVSVVGAPYRIPIDGTNFPAGPTAVIKGEYKGTASICVQAADQDTTIKKCYTWTVQ